MKENNKKSKLNKYYIFRVEKTEGKSIYSREKRIKMTTFDAKDDTEAYSFLKEYRKIANKEFTYYYDDVGKYVSMNNGKKTHFNTMDELMEDYSKRYNSIFHKISSWFRIKMMRFSDMIFYFKKIIYYIKHGHSMGESWDLFNHILDDIEYNLPILMDTITVPQYYEVLAYKKLNNDDSKTDFFDTPSRRIYDGNEKEYKLAKEMWNADLNKFLEDVMLYRYYDWYGIIDEKDEKYRLLNQKYANTIPYIPGRYKMINYKKLEELKTKQKNRIFDFLRKNCTTLKD